MYPRLRANSSIWAISALDLLDRRGITKRSQVKIKFQRDYYRNGQLREEMPFFKSVAHGIRVTWHPNGRIASKEPFRHGLPHGRARHWDDSGRLLGEYRMDGGTGIIREWHTNGRLKAEIPLAEGVACGRTRLWLSDGTLYGEDFYQYGRTVTRAAYAKAQKLDGSLPHYAGLTRKGYRRPNVPESYIEDLFVKTLLKDPNLVEAREWLALASPKTDTRRSLGRFRSTRKATQFVEAVYSAGALKVWVPGVYKDKKGNQFADVCVVQVPKPQAARLKVRRVSRLIVRQKLGSITPERDRGETHLLLGMW